MRTDSTPICSSDKFCRGNPRSSSIFNRKQASGGVRATVLFAYMITQTLTSDPAVALELGRRLALNARRPQRASTRLGSVWERWFSRVPVKVVSRHR